jgi:tetratricopeptide (TPR) repeat protein
VSTADEILAQAKACHRLGQLRQAESLYRQVLGADPAQFEACFLLGAVYRSLGQTNDAIACLAQAVRLNPSDAEACHHLGVSLEAAGRLDEAIAALQQAWRLRPSSPEIAQDLRRVLAAKEFLQGFTLAAQGRYAESTACYQRALELRPDNADAYYNLGVGALNLGQLDEAARNFRRAVELKPDFAEAHNNLGLVLRDLNDLNGAAACFRRALELKPDFAEAHGNLALVLRDGNQLDEAAACCERALALKPDFAAAYNCLAMVLNERGKPNEAQALFLRAIELKPDYADPHFNLANAAVNRRRLDEAESRYRRAIELKPDHADAHYNLALALLLLGRLEEAWPEYEWRFRRRGMAEQVLPRPRWTGEPLAGRAILLRCEQGMGDMLQFIRYAELVKQQGATVIAEVPPPLTRLAASCPGVDSVIEAGGPAPHFDVYLPLLSLPGVFRTSLATVPAKIPYLSPDEQSVAHWKAELGSEVGFKIGIAWQGSPAYKADRQRSIPLARFSPLASVPGVRLYSLQMGLGREQLQEVAGTMSITDLGDRLGDFHNTAAIMRNLDLIISCDSAPVHLAGAIGMPVWLPQTYVPDWRWMLERTDSPWYPSVRLFRQQAPGDWDPVFRAMRAELAAMV